jgi:hypothetical protein
LAGQKVDHQKSIFIRSSLSVNVRFNDVVWDYKAKPASKRGGKIMRNAVEFGVFHAGMLFQSAYGCKTRTVRHRQATDAPKYNYKIQLHDAVGMVYAAFALSGGLRRPMLNSREQYVMSHDH